MKKSIIISTTVILGIVAFGAVSLASGFSSNQPADNRVYNQDYEKHHKKMSEEDFSCRVGQHSLKRDRMKDRDNGKDHMKNNRRGYCHR